MPIQCSVCNRRNAVYTRKHKGGKKPDHVCATCMVACRVVFGDKPRDFTRIKPKD